ncbi:MAG: DUF1150 family protein [Pseudomonadota bacterium]
MYSRRDLFPDATRGIVYIKPVAVDDLPEEVQAEAGGLDELYAVHSASGERLALVADRRMAIALAAQNKLTPVTVH